MRLTRPTMVLLPLLLVVMGFWVLSWFLRVEMVAILGGSWTSLAAENGYVYFESTTDPPVRGFEVNLESSSASGSGCGYSEHLMPGFDAFFGHRDVIHIHYWLPTLLLILAIVTCEVYHRHRSRKQRG